MTIIDAILDEVKDESTDDKVENSQIVDYIELPHSLSSTNVSYLRQSSEWKQKSHRESIPWSTMP